MSIKQKDDNVPNAKTYELLKLSFVTHRRRWFLNYWVASTILFVASIFPAIDFLRPYYTVNDWYYTVLILYMFIFLGIHWASLFVVLRLLGLVCPNCDADFFQLNISPPSESGEIDAAMISHCPKCGAEIVDLDA